MSIEIASGFIVIYSKPNSETDNCCICQNKLNGKCPECEDKDSICESIFGICNHAYHYHCITEWLKNNNKCPLDRKYWEYKKVTDKKITYNDGVNKTMKIKKRQTSLNIDDISESEDSLSESSVSSNTPVVRRTRRRINI